VKHLSYLLLTLMFFSTPLLAETIKIGWIGPLTGPAAVLGEDSLNALRLAFKHADKENLQFEVVAEDDAYDTVRTVAAYNKLARAEGIDIIMVITYGGMFAVADQSKRDGVALLNPLDCDEAMASLPSNVICVAKLTEEMAGRAARDAFARGFERIAIIHFENDPFPLTMAEETQRVLKEVGMEPVVTEGYLRTQMDFRSVLARVRRYNPDAIFFYGYDELAAAMKQARELGMDAQFYTTANLASPGAVETAGEALDGTLVPVWTAVRGPEYEHFLNLFRAEYGRAPYIDLSTVPSFDFGNLIIQAADKASKKAFSSEVLLESLYKTESYQGASGLITIDSDGVTRTMETEIQALNEGRFEPPPPVEES